MRPGMVITRYVKLLTLSWGIGKYIDGAALGRAKELCQAQSGKPPDSRK